MIKKLLIYCFAFLPLLSFAQPLNSWPTQNAWWDILTYDEYNQLIGGRTYHLDGDTAIQGMTYQKVSYFYGPGNPEDYAGAVRADSLDRVYTVPKDSASEVLLYDFRAQVGDTLHNVFFGLFGTPFGLTDMVVGNIDTIILQDGPHIEMYLENQTAGYFGSVVDGIGSRPDFLVPSYVPNVSGYEELICMTNDSVAVIGNGNCLLTAVKEPVEIPLDIYPNPTTGAISLAMASPERVEMTLLLDVRGSVLKRWGHFPAHIDLEELPNGLYMLAVSGDGFRRTKKIVKR